jgi:hypothetical protein
MNKRLGNYQWVTCQKCGERYIICPNCDKHTCKETNNVKFTLFDRIKKLFK